MAVVAVALGRMFKGGEEVVLLSFGYDPSLVADLKAALAAARVDAGGDRLRVGGWAQRQWFVHPHCWPAVREALLAAGHTVEGDVGPLPVAMAEVGAEDREAERRLQLIARLEAAVAACCEADRLARDLLAGCLEGVRKEERPIHFSTLEKLLQAVEWKYGCRPAVRGGPPVPPPFCGDRAVPGRRA